MLGQSLGGLRPSLGPWTPYTPTVTQSGAITSFTTNLSRYVQQGKRVDFQVYLTINNAGGAVGANAVLVTLPVTAKGGATLLVDGQGWIDDSSVPTVFPGIVVLASVTAFEFMPSDITNNAVTIPLGALNFVAALATGDIIAASGTYEAA